MEYSVGIDHNLRKKRPMTPQCVRIVAGNHTQPGDHRILSQFVIENETSLRDELNDIMQTHNVCKSTAQKVMAFRGTSFWTSEKEKDLIAQEAILKATADAKQVWADFIKKITL